MKSVVFITTNYGHGLKVLNHARAEGAIFGQGQEQLEERNRRGVRAGDLALTPASTVTST
jgi:hypothetical protein